MEYCKCKQGGCHLYLMDIDNNLWCAQCNLQVNVKTLPHGKIEPEVFELVPNEFVDLALSKDCQMRLATISEAGLTLDSNEASWFDYVTEHNQSLLEKVNKHQSYPLILKVN